MVSDKMFQKLDGHNNRIIKREAVLFSIEILTIEWTKEVNYNNSVDWELILGRSKSK